MGVTFWMIDMPSPVAYTQKCAETGTGHHQLMLHLGVVMLTYAWQHRVYGV